MEEATWQPLEPDFTVAHNIRDPAELENVMAAYDAAREVTDEMIDRAAAAYVFGVMPGDESEATDAEIREMAERVLRAALRPSDDA